jgi:hypothetical protein
MYRYQKVMWRKRLTTNQSLARIYLLHTNSTNSWMSDVVYAAKKSHGGTVPVRLEGDRVGLYRCLAVVL